MYYIRRGGENKERREVHLCNVRASRINTSIPKIYHLVSIFFFRKKEWKDKSI